jgi:hypothetical protein
MATTYKPEGLAVLQLDDIPVLFNHPKTQIISDAFKGKKFMCKLPSGQLYFDSKLSLDTDGSPVYFPQDPSGQLHTSTKFPGGGDLDSDLINYFVLPGGFYPKHGINKGDIGVVIFGIRMAFACFGDVGPAGSLGEGSISLHRELGNEIIRNRDTASGGTLINRGIDSGVITIVFPGSGNTWGRKNAESKVLGEILFRKLKQEATSYQAQLAQFRNKVRDMFVPAIVRKF